MQQNILSTKCQRPKESIGWRLWLGEWRRAFGDIHHAADTNFGIQLSQKSRTGIAPGNAGGHFYIPPTIKRQIKHPKILIATKQRPSIAGGDGSAIFN